ncbi:MAG: hypothetical protein N2593_00035 [Patescibacteria group bacterium]|nr:hypothetical protein [Patescibacteria group bacterium]
MKERENNNFFYQIENKQKSSFEVCCYSSCFRRKKIGVAFFWKTDENIWKARVDVKNDNRNKGIGTELLRIGDDYIRRKYPDSIREFEALGNFGNTYLNQIPLENFISIEKNKYRFRL